MEPLCKCAQLKTAVADLPKTTQALHRLQHEELGRALNFAITPIVTGLQLDVIQYTDGNDKLILNRDDLSVFRLDSMVTHNKAGTQQINGAPALTTKTDYQASYPNKLQTTSYNFTGTNNTGELCGGVVKAVPLHYKNPAQHLADLEMLENEAHFEPAFVAKDRKKKQIECMRTDSGADEAPCYDEVQFWWTKRHFDKPTIVKLVTSRQSGGSNLNHVELQNECQVKARCGVFIRLCQNLSDSIDVYISRVQGATCGDAKIFHCKGADSSQYQDLRDKLLVFIRGTKEKRKRNFKEMTKMYTNTFPMYLKYGSSI